MLITDINSTLEIAASVGDVWALTVDVERWPELTPTMSSVERLDSGDLGRGSRARIKQPGLRPAVWAVTDFEPERLFAWETKLATVTLRAVHVLASTPNGCRNTLSVDLTGFGSGVLRALGGRKLLAAITTENAGFKEHAEARSRRVAEDQ